jgi:hypothetical protein
MFLTAVALQADPEPRIWIVLSPLIWEDPVFGRLTTPQGFRSDLASVPPIVRDIPSLDPNGISRPCALMHDFLYAWRMIGKDNADEFLRQSLLAVGASKLVSDVFYMGVHQCGQASWDSDNGALETRDFDTVEHYRQWQATLSPTFTTTIPGVI